MVHHDVAHALQSRRDQHLEQFIELLRFASIANNDDDQCPACAAWLVNHLTDLGLAARTLPTGGKDVVYAESDIDPDKPTLLIYGHYDVQPPDPLNQWLSDPFDPHIRDGNIYARGASDDKGQFLVHLMAIEAWQQAGGGLPMNVKVLLEGEEEIGSPSLESFMIDHADLFAADAAVVSDSAFYAAGVPSILTGLRGLAYVQLNVTGPAVDVHSGIYGGIVANPVNALAAMIGQMHDETGRVTLPGFYDDVAEPTDEEARAWETLDFDEAAYAKSVGARELGGGERHLPPLVRSWARPTLDVNGIIGGYTDPGAKTIIPAEAHAKISMRLVPHQDPRNIVEGVKEFVRTHTPPGVRVEIDIHSTAPPVLLKTDGVAIQAAQAAMTEAFGREAIFIRCGASVPVTELIQRTLGLDAAMMGFGLPDDNLHSPNEKFSLEHFCRGAVASAALMSELAARLA
ncbi:MAG: dipeptidase [Planctomycetota bacterium]|jgi:acetylornithine deacetylase/succinyl-diaminopimelate desuccinylase-like protein